MTLSLLLPLAAALVYGAGVMLVKRASDLGAGVWRTAFVANLVAACAFQPLLILGGEVRWDLWWQPFVTASCFVLGQWLRFIALDRGDVSVATPVMGLKILLVALLTVLLGGASLRWQLWTSAVLATAGIALLGAGGTGGVHHHVGRTVVAAGLSAAVFALYDVLVQLWAPAWGTGRFLPITMGLSALLSLGFVGLFRAPLTALPRTTWPWLLGGAVLLGIQSMLFVSSIAQWGHAAMANVLYSSRGLWTVVLVWTIGHWVHSREQRLGRRILGARLAGALLMLSAIALVLA